MQNFLQKYTIDLAQLLRENNMCMTLRAVSHQESGLAERDRTVSQNQIARLSNS